jgi:hypothetical protein
MKNLLFILLLLLGNTQLNAQKTDSIAAKVVEANLTVITDYLEKKAPSLQKISDATAYLTELTGIPSESDGKYYGQFKPTANDLKAWTTWYQRNKEYLFWDKELQSVILYKAVKATIF